MTTQFADTTKVAIKSHGKECLKRKPLRHPRKADVVDVHVISLADMDRIVTSGSS